MLLAAIGAVALRILGMKSESRGHATLGIVCGALVILAVVAGLVALFVEIQTYNNESLRTQRMRSSGLFVPIGIVGEPWVACCDVGRCPAALPVDNSATIGVIHSSLRFGSGLR
jgi:hypothetical protein